MRRFLLSLIFGGVSLYMLGGCAATAQTRGGGGQSPSTPQSPSTAGTPGSRDMNNPANTPGNGPEAMTTKMDDKKFVKDAALGGMTEVELGKLAAQKASNDAVKQFGQKMVDDHTKANDELKQIAGKENINVPDSLDSKHQSRIDKLSKLSGSEFDKAYIKDQVKDHQQDVNEFQSEAQGGSDPNIKQFASSTLPTLQEHLSKAKEVSKQVKQESSSKKASGTGQ